MVCEEISVYVSWLRTMSEVDFRNAMIYVWLLFYRRFFNEMGLEAKENSCAKFLELRKENI